MLKQSKRVYSNSRIVKVIEKTYYNMLVLS